ncbi:hypothetical protein GGI20_006274 [Coemansia sp. BCRC 34301]|nr:hypothetical protein GGI20_006274 [Coemansia sp. BCRC 34301]
MLGVSCCGANKDRGMDLLKNPLGALDNSDFGRLAEQQALVLCQWIGRVPNAKGNKRQNAEAAIANTTGVVGDWLKGTFRELARRASHQEGVDSCMQKRVAYSMQLVASAIYGKNQTRSGSADAQRMVIQSLDMVILAASIAGTKAAVDELLVMGVACWLLPLLTGLGAQAVCRQSQAAASGDGRQALLIVAAGEMLRHMERGASHGQAVVVSEQQPVRHYSAQLRTRVLALLDLAQSPVPRRALRLVLAHLAQLGMLPLSDLQRAV